MRNIINILFIFTTYHNEVTTDGKKFVRRPFKNILNVNGLAVIFNMLRFDVVLFFRPNCVFLVNFCLK